MYPGKEECLYLSLIGPVCDFFFLGAILHPVSRQSVGVRGQGRVGQKGSSEEQRSKFSRLKSNRGTGTELESSLPPQYGLPQTVLPVGWGMIISCNELATV